MRALKATSSSTGRTRNQAFWLTVLVIAGPLPRAGLPPPPACAGTSPVKGEDEEYPPPFRGRWREAPEGQTRVISPSRHHPAAFVDLRMGRIEPDLRLSRGDLRTFREQH